MSAQGVNIMTENAMVPSGWIYLSPLASAYTVAMTHGSPSPKNTFTELLPVTLPTAASASGAMIVAVREANVSGIEVPKATMVIATIGLLIPIIQPNVPANSPIKNVTSPITAKDEKNVTQPLQYPVGGKNAKIIFHGKDNPWRKKSIALGSSGQLAASSNCSCQLPVDKDNCFFCLFQRVIILLTTWLYCSSSLISMRHTFFWGYNWAVLFSF